MPKNKNKPTQKSSLKNKFLLLLISFEILFFSINKAKGIIDKNPTKNLVALNV